MVKRLCPALVVAILPVIVVILSGCSGAAAEAAPLNVAAINGIKAYHVKMQETIHIQSRTINVKLTEDAVTPDRVRAQITAQADGQTVTANSIGIGNQVWVRTDADWREQSFDASFRQ